MKKILAFILALLFFLNTWGYYWIYWYNRYTVRSEMHAMLKSGFVWQSIEVLRITNPLSNPDFKRTDSREFLYRGNLYDIISESHNKDITVFYCINDKKEETALSCFRTSFDQFTSHANPSRARHAQAMLYHIITLALVNELNLRAPLHQQPVLYYSPVFLVGSSFTLQVAHPPEA